MPATRCVLVGAAGSFEAWVEILKHFRTLWPCGECGWPWVLAGRGKQLGVCCLFVGPLVSTVEGPPWTMAALPCPSMSSEGLPSVSQAT